VGNQRAASVCKCRILSKFWLIVEGNTTYLPAVYRKER
jgi:hypothetical protein